MKELIIEFKTLCSQKRDLMINLAAINKRLNEIQEEIGKEPGE